MALTELEVKKAKVSEKPKKLADGGGMYLLVQTSGTKCWRMDYRFEGKRKTLALGVYPEVSMADARDRREEARRLLANGCDPGAIKKEAKQQRKKTSQDTVNGFGTIALEYLAMRAPMWTESPRVSWRLFGLSKTVSTDLIVSSKQYYVSVSAGGISPNDSSNHSWLNSNFNV